MANAGADAEVELAPVSLAVASADVAAAVVAVLATLATEAIDEEAEARRGSAAVQNDVTWFSTGERSLLLGQLL